MTLPGDPRPPEPRASALAGARVVVTGGAGFVGSHIVDAAILAGAREVVALDALVRGVPANLEPALASGRVTLRQTDIRDRAAVTEAIAGADFVLHQAALVWNLCQEDPRLCQEVMVDGTFNVLEASAAAGVKRVVLASSAIAYGDTSRLPIDEDQPLSGRTVYGAAKVANEQMARAFAQASRLPVVCLRYFNLYGPRMAIRSKFTDVLVKWLDRIDAGEPLLINGDGSASLDFVYVGDAVRANLLACECSALEATVNVCSGVETSLDDLAGLMLRLTASRSVTEHRPEPPGTRPSRRVGDPTRAAETLGFRAEVPLEEGLRRLIAWRREALG